MTALQIQKGGGVKQKSKTTTAGKTRRRIKTIVQRFPATQPIRQLALDEQRQNRFTMDTNNNIHNRDTTLSYNPFIPIATGQHAPHEMMQKQELLALKHMLLTNPKSNLSQIPWTPTNDLAPKYTCVVSNPPEPVCSTGLVDTFLSALGQKQSKKAVYNVAVVSPQNTFVGNVANTSSIGSIGTVQQVANMLFRHYNDKIQQQHNTIHKWTGPDGIPALLYRLKQHVEYVTKNKFESCTLVHYPSGESYSTYHQITPPIASIQSNILIGPTPPWRAQCGWSLGNGPGSTPPACTPPFCPLQEGKGAMQQPQSNVLQVRGSTPPACTPPFCQLQEGKGAMQQPQSNVLQVRGSKPPACTPPFYRLQEAEMQPDEEARLKTHTVIIPVGGRREFHIRHQQDPVHVTGLLPHDESILQFTDSPKTTPFPNNTNKDAEIHHASTDWEIAWPKRSRLDEPTVIIMFHTWPAVSANYKN